jgi:hypothetical protein
MEFKCPNGHIFTPTVTHPVCPACDQPGTLFTPDAPAKEAVAPIMQGMGPSVTWEGKKKKK